MSNSNVTQSGVDKKYITTDIIAFQLEVDPQTVRLWCKTGYLPASKFGKFYRVEQNDYENFLNSGKLAN